MKNTIVTFFASVIVFFAVGTANAAEKLLPEAQVNDDGLYTQPWFMESFLDLKEDVAESAAAGKHLAILWEQRGCPYCRETHMVNLRNPEIVAYIKKNFNVIQMNLWGDKEVTDFDGTVTTEKKFARKNGIQFTPTIQFFPMELKEGEKKQQVWRLLGYWKPFHFLNSFVYVKDGDYQKEPNFQRWLQARAEKLREEGKEINMWDN
ncbi:MAG: thioredoxin family protein [Rhodospirillales bacterium]|nr:thioredoxin family protein [Rhodospirillales bacterium]